jgi:serine/threonine protein kinase
MFRVKRNKTFLIFLPRPMAKRQSIEQLISEADKLEEALDLFNDFLKRCEEEQFSLAILRSRLASVKTQKDVIDGIDRGDAQLERNQIRATFLERLLHFRQEAMSGVFDMQGRAEFLASIRHRDQVIHEILDQRLLPKRYRRDQDIKTLSSKHEKDNTSSARSKNESKILEGNSSIIYRLYNIDTRRHAIAMVLKTPDLDENFKNEIQRLTDLRHRNVIKLLDHETSRFPYFIITEYVYGDTLDKALKLTGPRPVPQVADWLYQLTEALDYLRHKRIIHTNVRPSKIFIDDEWQIMLSPFDLLKMAPQTTSYHKQPSSNTQNYNSYERTFNRYRDVCQYGSPEQLMGDGEVIIQKQLSSDQLHHEVLLNICNSDLYSIGLIGYKMLTAKDLFEGPTVYQILQNRQRFVSDSAFRQERLALLPSCELTEIIHELLQEDQTERRNKFPNLHKLLRRLHQLTRLDDPQSSDVRSSYRRCLASNKEFIRDFYEHYYTKEGAKAQNFSEIGRRRQSAMLQMAVDVLIDFDSQKTYLYEMMRPDNAKHSAFTIADFEVFLDTLLETIAKNDYEYQNTDGLDMSWKNVRDRTIAYIKELRS